MYDRYFNFSDRPFKLSPDPKFFFSSPQHKKALSYLHYGLSLGEGFIVVTGPIGSGKTTIARNLVSSVDYNVKVIQLVMTHLSPGELLALVANGLGIISSHLSKADLIKQIEQQLLLLNQQNKRALLVVDEAQNLPVETVEELRMLSNLQVEGMPLIQSFLLGQEELKSIIDLPQMEQFRQRVIASCHLKAFDTEQTEQYILHRLTQVGWNEFPRLDADIFPIVANQSMGIPRKINLIMDRILLSASLEESENVDVEMVEEAISEVYQEISASIHPSKVYQSNIVPSSAVSRNENFINNQEVTQQHYIELQKSLNELIITKLSTIKHMEQIINSHQSEMDGIYKNRVKEGMLSSKRWLTDLAMQMTE